jgi:nucleolar protein 9
LFHNANLFGSCIIHILYTECAKIKKNNSSAKGLMYLMDNVCECQISGTQTEDTEFTHWVIKVSRFVLNNLEEFVWDTYANHVIRTVTDCLGGISSETAGNFKKPVKPEMKIATGLLVKLRKVSPEYTELLKEFVHRLSAWPQFQGWYPVKV